MPAVNTPFWRHDMARKKINSTWSLAKRLGIPFAKASPIMLFRTFILFYSLTIAMIAILQNTFDENVRSFLTGVLMYAALTKGQ